jgi:hypothetical protein
MTPVLRAKNALTHLCHRPLPRIQAYGAMVRSWPQAPKIGRAVECPKRALGKVA